MGNLKGRIARLRESGGIGGLRQDALRQDAHRQDEVPERTPLPGWERIGRHLLRREARTALLAPDTWKPYARLAAGSAPFALSPGEPLFFDLETTGLSGGAGTLAFLAALGSFEGADFIVTQFLLTDFPGERGFLESVSAAIAERPCLVTYNGAAFDLPLLRSRCIMNGVPLGSFDHLDLLHDARRLWRALYGSCSLQSMEREILDFRREGDVPGSLIPAIWQAYARGEGSPAQLAAVAEHNVRDVESLARLFFRVSSVLEDPLAVLERIPFDRFAVGLGLTRAFRLGEARTLFSVAGESGDQRALRWLARERKRLGDVADYARIVESMDGQSLEGCVEKAKLWEHVRRDPERALDWARKALVLAGSGAGRGGKGPLTPDCLRRRIARLEAKVCRRAARRLP